MRDTFRSYDLALRASTAAVVTAAVLALFFKVHGDLKGNGELQPLSSPDRPG